MKNSYFLNKLKINLFIANERKLNKEMQMISDVHNEHLKLMKQSLNYRINTLENKLSQTQGELTQQQSLIDNFKEQLQLDNHRLSQSILDLMNNPENRLDANHDNFHQEVVKELECQLESMRSECLLQVDKVKEECDDHIFKQK